MRLQVMREGSLIIATLTGESGLIIDDQEVQLLANSQGEWSTFIDRPSQNNEAFVVIPMVFANEPPDPPLVLVSDATAMDLIRGASIDTRHITKIAENIYQAIIVDSV